MTEEHVVLVDSDDKELGTMGKLEAHQRGLLHRAISVFIFDHDDRLLLQQRAAAKYHTPGLWTNTCCSHPAAGEAPLEAAHRRLHQEMGMAAPLEFAFRFQYEAPFDNGLVEHEVDHVFIGRSTETPLLNPDEVQDSKWCSQQEIAEEVAKSPEKFTAWFKLIYERVFALLPDIKD